MKLNQKGFTLIEMVVVMAVFVVVIAITGNSFNAILTHTSKLFRSEESNIEGVLGLEMLRHDIQQAGYGLFSEVSPVAYDGEAVAAPASNFNDGTTGPPRALVTGTFAADTAISEDSGGGYKILAGSDYLAIKATTVARNKTAQKWTYLSYSSSAVTPHSWQSNAENFSSSDKVVLLRRRISTSTNRAELVPSTLGDSYIPFSSSAFENMSSTSASVMTVYGVDDSATLRMPFNRTDYFVAAPPAGNRPSVCSPNSAVGVLYKTTVNQIGGTLNFVPVLDCVADMQIVLGWDLRDSGCAAGSDGQIDTWSNSDGTVVARDANVTCNADSAEVVAAQASAELVRSNLKIIKVYILAQQGRKDLGYTNRSPVTVGDVGETALTRSYALPADMLNYRWKVYRLIARPKNLLANQ
jgi:prepilin-type N-terminal cleavage/methylation domain-containing protein